jgi:hypothetical protein
MGSGSQAHFREAKRDEAAQRVARAPEGVLRLGSTRVFLARDPLGRGIPVNPEAGRPPPAAVKVASRRLDRGGCCSRVARQDAPRRVPRRRMPASPQKVESRWSELWSRWADPSDRAHGSTPRPRRWVSGRCGGGRPLEPDAIPDCCWATRRRASTELSETAKYFRHNLTAWPALALLN